jgi:hypothetical protein
MLIIRLKMKEIVDYITANKWLRKSSWSLYYVINAGTGTQPHHLTTVATQRVL